MAEYELTNRYVNQVDALTQRRRAIERGTNINIIDPTIDSEWAHIQRDSSGPQPYYDYFYSGEDIRVYMAETADDPEFGDIPIVNMAFKIEQEKMPLYGYADYTYNHMMRGTRIVTGAMSIATKYPGYMKDLLSKAAKNRQENSISPKDDFPAPAAWREDDENIEQYWGRHLDASALAQTKTEWSIHPPFNLVVVYGVQNTSVDPANPSAYYDMYGRDNQLLFDRNQRLIEDPDTRHPSRIVLEGCELTAVAHGYAPGNVVVENYQFAARDVIIPTPQWLSYNASRGSSSGAPAIPTNLE